MLTPADQDVLRKTYSPQFEAYLVEKLNTTLNDLPNVALEQVQKFQGRALVLRELLAELRHSAGISANRIAKP